MMYEITVHENLRFGSSKREREAGVFKNLTSGTPRFENLPFWCTKMPFTCGRKAITTKKMSVFKNIRKSVDGGLNKQ